MTRQLKIRQKTLTFDAADILRYTVIPYYDNIKVKVNSDILQKRVQSIHYQGTLNEVLLYTAAIPTFDYIHTTIKQNHS